MTVTTPSPVHVDADLEPGLSRWLWLLKWVLALPHFVILVFLWLAFVVTSAVAFVGILVTGRYPRPIFEFNVGVLRWSWRVAYYAYGALGTDRYPPFTLEDVPDYPAHLEIEYPGQLSRGLVLVKWWLLAIPHYLVLGLLLGGAEYAARSAHAPRSTSVGLIEVLVLVAGVVLLFTGSYPQRLFDLVLGLNRWVLRVAAYVALMTDRYPPFALDQGGHEPDGGLVTRPAPPPPPPAPTSAPTSAPATPVLPPRVSEPTDVQQPPGAPPAAGSPSAWTPGRVVSLVAGSIVAVLVLALGAAGAGLLVVDRWGRNDAGYVMSRSYAMSTPGYAFRSDSVQMHDMGSGAPHAMLGTFRVNVVPAGAKDVFVGIGRSDRVERYLAGSAYAVVESVRGHRVVSRDVAGGALPTPPGEQTFWSRHSSGSGPQSLTWPTGAGPWTMVVLNADGSPSVSTTVSAGATVPALPWAGGVLLVLALLGAVVSVLLISGALRRVNRAAIS